MNYERSKAPLALMEQIIMILVFAMAAAVCLQAFVYSNTLSKQSSDQDVASSHAQEIAEYLKEQKDVDAVCEKLSGQITEDGAVFSYPEDHMTVRLVIREDRSDDYMLATTISALNDNEETLFSIDVACQRLTAQE